jgi:hypothetical protein
MLKGRPEAIFLKIAFKLGSEREQRTIVLAVCTDVGKYVDFVL